MKKIHYVANARLPTKKAHGLAIMKMCEAFAKTDIETDLVVPFRRNSIKEDPFAYYGIERGFKIKRIPSLDLVWLGKIGFMAQWLSFAILTTAHTLLDKSEIRYGRDELALLFLSFFHRNIFWEAHTAKDNFVTKSLLNRAKGLVVVSNGLKDFYVSMGVNEGKILVAPSGVDLRSFESIKETKEGLRRELNLPIDKKIIAYIGKLKTMGVSKGVGELTLIFEELKMKDPQIHPLIVHDIHPSLVPKYMKAADVLLMNYPNTEHYSKYMSPLKLFEYMASGTPLISNDLPSVREIINKNNGVLVESNDLDTFVSETIRLIKDPKKISDLSKQAISDVYKYTWENRAKDVKKFITK